jgi:hypothetical protein
VKVSSSFSKGAEEVVREKVSESIIVNFKGSGGGGERESK